MIESHLAVGLALRLFNYSYHVFLRNVAEPIVMSRRYAAKLKDRLG